MTTARKRHRSAGVVESVIFAIHKCQQRTLQNSRPERVCPLALRKEHPTTQYYYLVLALHKQYHA